MLLGCHRRKTKEHPFGHAIMCIYVSSRLTPCHLPLPLGTLTWQTSRACIVPALPTFSLPNSRSCSFACMPIWGRLSVYVSALMSCPGGKPGGSKQQRIHVDSKWHWWWCIARILPKWVQSAWADLDWAHLLRPHIPFFPWFTDLSILKHTGLSTVKSHHHEVASVTSRSAKMKRSSSKQTSRTQEKHRGKCEVRKRFCWLSALLAEPVWPDPSRLPTSVWPSETAAKKLSQMFWCNGEPNSVLIWEVWWQQ